MDALEIINLLIPMQSKLAFEYQRFQKELKKTKRVEGKARREQEAKDRLTSLNRCFEL